jgi:DNA-binding response OmpR family regulator
MATAIRPLTERVVLVVDDEPVVCLMMARILAEAGFHVLEAHGGEAAMALLSTLSDAVQLVVSDITMPGLTGMELARRMAVEWPAVPILLISGRGGPEPGYSGPYLPKPFTADALLNAVAVLVRLPKARGAVKPSSVCYASGLRRLANMYLYRPLRSTTPFALIDDLTGTVRKRTDGG